MSARLHDFLLVLLSLGLVALLLLLARSTQRRQPLPSFTFRKLLHAAIGLLTLAMTTLFHDRGWALVPPAIFIALNASPRLREFVPGLAEGAREVRGLWLFPLGVCLTYIFFWDVAHRGAVLAGIAALAVGDPAAALLGRRLGQRRYVRWAYGRSLEGSLAFFLVAGAACAWIAYAIPGGPTPLRAGVGCGIAGAVAEAISPPGIDNLAIPLLVAATYRFLVTA